MTSRPALLVVFALSLAWITMCDGVPLPGRGEVDEKAFAITVPLRPGFSDYSPQAHSLALQRYLTKVR